MSNISFKDVARGIWQRNVGPKAAEVKALPAPTASPIDALPAGARELAGAVQASKALGGYSDLVVTHRAGEFTQTRASRVHRDLYGENGTLEQAGLGGFGIGLMGGIAGALTAIASAEVGSVIATGGLALGALYAAGFCVSSTLQGLKRARWSARPQPESNVTALRDKVEAARAAAGDDPLAQTTAYLLTRRAIDTLRSNRAGLSAQTELWLQELVCDRPKVSDAVMEQAQRAAAIAIAGSVDASAEIMREAAHLSPDERRALDMALGR